MKLTKQNIQRFQSTIFRWWETNKRDLPWRHTHDPYNILVSEVMLQQTQVPRVIAKYREFIERYPTVNSLALASPGSVLRAWKGMGYNRRALYLQKAARAIVERYKGIFPRNEQELRELPGLGTYTARAILVFAFKQNVSMVDTNIRQIITHYFFNDSPQKEKVIQITADQLLPKGKSWEWHQALMDYGALKFHEVKMKRPEQSRGTTIPFKNSNRLFRGRIVDRLREEDIKERKLIDEFASLYKKDDQFIRHIIEGLMKDGLISRRKGFLSLPE
ncbi:hypothetical protein A2Z00_05085 [Candidatus Gottesmanbacteria bacterium RBG_13_45_10]|uniref:Adenine DNA glycosylase n=1 Tax=Candidatus Gottesmanbacteria bacterium RBG_13_45_10 TaxID=1798370 RepID=A0A1F5ZHJ4_9BACT|nr:MAG: hypothetical protein A2Z00_05085 [Candidatus Gottesmanbacteria bacterium RBG_13_45_10]